MTKDNAAVKQTLATCELCGGTGMYGPHAVQCSCGAPMPVVWTTEEILAYIAADPGNGVARIGAIIGRPADLEGPVALYREPPPPQSHLAGDTITLTPAEAWSLLYNDPKDVRAQTITKMAVWLDGLRFIPATAAEGSDNG
ncbi:hypothetical protein [Neorhizobium galegae]|uniref:hypothetical protein n=1 Tax=Neorhizobium galegae TaxID=399 RepID=UPI000621E709|nr:hypothetical protein [Neorhizobium galegae]CDZ55077.1 Hypothetical protein NGAL_HAMBI2427_59830 [Neorhizobium galegae bv. orientalis]